MEKIIATFNNSEQAEKALLDLRNHSHLDGVTVIAMPNQTASQSSGSGQNEQMDGMATFGNIANQVIETSATAGRLVGSISGMVAVGLFSLPMMVLTPFMQGQNNSDYLGNGEAGESNPNHKQIVTVMGDSDLIKARDILVKNGAEITHSNVHL